MTPAELLDKFDQELFDFLHRAQPRSETFQRMTSEHLAWRSWDDFRPTEASSRGKRVRPLLALLTAQAITGDHQRAVPAGIAVQLVHDFSIILDDIMDHDRVRRARPALWVTYGTGHAMTAAASLYILGLDALQDYLSDGTADSRGTPAEPRHLTRTLLESCLELADAQHTDLDWEHRLDITLDQVRAVALGRSCLLRCGVELATAVSTPDPQVRAAFREFGALVSTAFSVVDDHQGLWGSEERNGKPLHSDLRGHKKTYPVVAGYLHATAAGRKRLETLLTTPDPDEADFAAIMELLDESNAAAVTLREVERLSRAAVDILRRPPLARFAVTDLIQLTERMFATPTPSLSQGGSTW